MIGDCSHDLKPAVLLAANSPVKLSDFCIASCLAIRGSTAGNVLGTVEFMAPSRPMLGRSDLVRIS